MTELSIIPDGGMVVTDGIIRQVGPSVEMERAASGHPTLDMEGRVVCPGFVDAHTHLVFAGNRLDDFERRAQGESYEQIAAAGGIWSTVQKTRSASESELLAQARRQARRFLACGTTTIEAKSGYGLTLESELKILRVIRQLQEEEPSLEYVPTFLGAHAVPPSCQPDDYLDLVIDEMLPAVANERLAEYADVFCEKGYFNIEQSRRVLLAAQKAGLKSRGHVDQLTNSGGAQLMAEVGAVTADHLEKTDERGIEALAAAQVQPVLLPASVYGLGASVYPRAREMIEAGLAVVLATDFNPGSSPTPSMPMVLSIACTHLKMTPAEALSAATINAACSLGRGGNIGSLEPGKTANFAVFDCQDYRELAYWFGLPQTHAVYRRGDCVYRAGRGD